MATTTQYNPNADLNRRLLAAGASKTVYALVTPETERAKATAFQGPAYLELFRDAWTSKQDGVHEEFFNAWVIWASPVVSFNRNLFPFYYPTAGASEALRHLIYGYVARMRDMWATIHVFEGEYEGYKAMAEAAGVSVHEHKRENWERVTAMMRPNDMFFISAPSAIDGNVWADLNAFLAVMPENSVVLDVTYVGAIPAIAERLDLNAPSVRNVVFSLSKPYGVYYDRIGGVWCREQDLGLFGNRWFKNLSSLQLGTALMRDFDVFYLPRKYARTQAVVAEVASTALDLKLEPADVYLLATAEAGQGEVADYIRRAGRLRLCLTPGMAETIGTSGKVR